MLCEFHLSSLKLHMHTPIGPEIPLLGIYPTDRIICIMEGHKDICTRLFTIALFLFFFINLLIYIFIYFWLSWVFIAAHGLSLVVASGGYSLLRCAGFPLWWLLLLRSTGSRPAGFSSCGSWALERRLSCSMACGIFPDQGLNPCPLHWQADS